jgi:hypothetical protein
MEQWEQLKTEVFKQRPILDKIYKQHGALSLTNYVKSWKINLSADTGQILSLVKDQYAQIYGADVALGVVAQLGKLPLVSTVDHHGLFGHPFFLNSNLLFSLYSGLDYLPVLATAGVSMNNSSWPGCLVLTDPRTGKIKRLSFFPDGHKTKTVFAAARITEQQVNKVLAEIGRLNFLDSAKKLKLATVVKDIFLANDVLAGQNFSNQACLINHKLWQRVFPIAPQLAYLSLEDLVAEIIIKNIATNPTHILYQLMFTSAGWLMLEKYFIGLKGAFGKTNGSFLFWGVDEQGRRVSLVRQGAEVVDDKTGIGYRMSAVEISQALGDRKIYPTSLTCFLVTLYYNLNCLGGFNQTSWLTEIKEKFSALLVEMGERALAEEVLKVATDNFAETPLALSLTNNSLIKSSLVDLYLADVDYGAVVQISKQITLAQSLETELPEIYKIVVPEQNRSSELLAITSGNIAQSNGLTKILGLL